MTEAVHLVPGSWRRRRGAERLEGNRAGKKNRLF